MTKYSGGQACKNSKTVLTLYGMPPTRHKHLYTAGMEVLAGFDNSGAIYAKDCTEKSDYLSLCQFGEFPFISDS